ncbi:MAG: hypothetical protein ACPGUV_10775 [Polyangiales bacterium]
MRLAWQQSRRALQQAALERLPRYLTQLQAMLRRFPDVEAQMLSQRTPGSLSE